MSQAHYFDMPDDVADCVFEGTHKWEQVYRKVPFDASHILLGLVTGEEYPPREELVLVCSICGAVRKFPRRDRGGRIDVS